MSSFMDLLAPENLWRLKPLASRHVELTGVQKMADDFDRIIAYKLLVAMKC